MRTRRFRISRHLFTFLLAGVLATLAYALWPPERLPSPLLAHLHNLEWLGYDALFALRGETPQRIDPRIAVVGFDQNTERTLNTSWPPSRRLHARVIDHLVTDGATLIVFDVMFTGATTPTDDRALDAALARANRVVLGCRLERDLALKRVSLEAPYYDDALRIDFERSTRTGFAELPLDPTIDKDRVIRRFVPVMSFQDHWLPSLASAAYLAMTQQGDEAIRVTPKAVWLGNCRIPRTGPTAPDPVYPDQPIPSAYLDFPGGIDTFPRVPLQRFEQVYARTFAPGTFRDKIVFVGVTGSELAKRSNELFTTAYTHMNPEGNGAQITTAIPGVIIQAQVLNALLRHGLIHPLPGWARWLVIFIFALAAIWWARQYVNWRGPVLLAVTTAVYLGCAVLLFGTWRIHLPWVLPNLLILAAAGGTAWIERGRLRRKWGGYVSPDVLARILQSDSGLEAERYEASVVFGDIRGFTAFSERHKPETVVRLLNRHLERLTRIIYAERGTIDKFLGDGILAVYGAPLPMQDAAVRAVRSAWHMREVALQAIHDDDGTPHVFGSGFGITTGPLVAGHVGSRQRHEFTIIGDTVNLASRLQGVTGQPDVIIDAATLDQVRAHVAVESLGEVTLKGKSQPIACYRVTAWHETPSATPALTPPETAR